MAFLACDSPAVEEQISHYVLAGLPGDPQVPPDASGDYGFQYDLTAVPEGSYSVRVSACNAWECSLPAPFDFVRPKPVAVPTGVGIIFA